MKYIIVTGSVMSGIGKGITASSIGVCLKAHGLKVTAIKIDPYINIDCGTMSPFEHGECYVLDDGGETDLDLGNYERFLNINLTKNHNITTGKIYDQIIKDERKGKYLGKTVQINPHFTDAVQNWIHRTANLAIYDTDADPHKSKPEKPQICIIELGGTVGDIESQPFVEALRQLKSRSKTPNDVLVVNVSYIPVLRTSDETKTKPTQHGIQTLRSMGLIPDILCLRCERELSPESKAKLSDFCQIPESHILLNPDVDNIYQIPLAFHQAGLAKLLDQHLQIWKFPNIRPADFKLWQYFADKLYQTNRQTIKVAIIGKYTKLNDSYLSLLHAIKHACVYNDVNHQIDFFDSEEIEKLTTTNNKNSSTSTSSPSSSSSLSLSSSTLKIKKLQSPRKFWHKIKTKYDAIIIPGGFGQRGLEGMIQAVQVARTNQIPCLGICLGFQVQVIEYARNVLNLPQANSSEFDPTTSDPVITIIDSTEENLGGTMRLGSLLTLLDKNSYASNWYNNKILTYERYRHRYEVNPKYLELFIKNGLLFPGRDQSNFRMEILNLPPDQHPFYAGTQFHGEYQTRPHQAHPVFKALIKNAKLQKLSKST